MELLLLDKNFQICGLIDDFSSLVWNRKYYECGNFNLQIGIKYWEQFRNAMYIYSKEFRETGILKTLSYKTTTQGTDIQRSGQFLESILADRAINKTQNFKNMITEDIIRSLVNTFCINAGTRSISNLVLGERRGLGRSRTMQMTGDNLLDRIYELCKEDELSIQLWYDFDNNKMVFEVWQGLDRRDTQNINTWAIFSRNFENILEDEYSVDETQYKNFAYVAGEDTGGNRIIVEVDRIRQGEKRKELYVDARDLQKDENTTDAEYKEILKERGIEKLNEYNKVEIADFSIDTLANLKYKTDFDLGDKAVYKNDELGFNVENRIIGISEVYENGNMTLDVSFGNDYNIKKVKEVI
ncbi:MAG: hypothetical protein HFJ53_00955 [Clostridia bacterium]|jgi:hypothetical protein|nr:hypothetical protein [Clostridia bacterium]